MNLIEKIDKVIEENLTSSKLFNTSNEIFTDMRNLVNELAKTNQGDAIKLNKIAIDFIETTKKIKINKVR